VAADFDLAIVGSGFAGSLLAMIARRLGARVALIERGRHPRFAIGESASPLAGVVIEQLADRYDLPRIRPLGSYGAWQRHYPEIGCGLKRGFTYFKHARDVRYRAAPDRANQLLVAASPSDEVADTHWLRADVDRFLVTEAASLGVDYMDTVSVDALEWRPDGEVALRGARGGRSWRLSARAIVDATGPRGLLARLLSLDAPGFAGYPSTQALYSHFVDVARCEHMPEYASADTPPYPIDAAALHHVFDEGWMWVLRFGNGVTSAGVAVTDALAADLRLSDGEPAWTRLLARYPSIAAQFADARAIREFTWMPHVPYRASRAAGAGWAMLPSAAGFVDPLFSTGMPLTLLGVERLAAILEAGAPGRPAGADADRRLREYEQITLAEADHTARFVAGCYAAFPRFQDFTAGSMFYFAAASYSEMARRLGRPTRGFLCMDDAEYAAAMARLSPDEVAGAIDRFNVAGLCDPAKRNWYGVDLQETVRSAWKLGVTPDAVAGVLSMNA
jgi:FADH2 O2-dependent halogenase